MKNIKRCVVNTAEKVSAFFATDLQNHYYKYLFLENAKKNIGAKKYEKDPKYERESVEYWKKHTGLKINTVWHDFYSTVNGIKDVRYVPENLYYAYIEPFYNRKDFCQCCDDKCYYTERFPDNVLGENASRAGTIVRNIGGLFFDCDFQILSENDAVQKVANIDTGYVIKESITGSGGNRIIFVEPKIKKTPSELREVFRRYKKDFVVEDIIKQCKELEILNPSSINTIRFITFMDQNGVHCLSSVMRIGGKGSKTDNFSTGGMACGIDENGQLKEIGYDQQYNKYIEVHPNGIKFAGVQVPGFETAKELVTNIHRRFGHFRIISWDIAIGKDYKPIIIEFNLTPQSIDFHQINNGPLFGDYTDQVLEEVFKCRR